MILFEESPGSVRAPTEPEVNFEDLLDKEEEIIFAEDDEPNRCLAGFYGGTHSERGLRCSLGAEDHERHLSEKDWWGVSLMWKDDQPEATSHYLTRPSRKSKRAARRSTLRVFLLKNQKALES